MICSNTINKKHFFVYNWGRSDAPEVKYKYIILDVGRYYYTRVILTYYTLVQITVCATAHWIY